MKHKQKLGYMVLGAGIMAVGITIGQIITPDIEAQNNGVFDQITCNGLIVLDKAGKRAVALGAAEVGNAVVVFDKAGKEAVALGAADFGNTVTVFDKAGKGAVGLAAGENTNGLVVHGKAGNEEIVVGTSEEYANVIQIIDRAGNVSWQAP